MGGCDVHVCVCMGVHGIYNKEVHEVKRILFQIVYAKVLLGGRMIQNVHTQHDFIIMASYCYSMGVYVQ